MGARSASAPGVPLTGGSISGALAVTGDVTSNGLVTPPTATQTVTASTAILANARLVQISAAGITTITAAPTIANGSDGQWLRVVNVGSNAITIQDQGTLANSNLRLNAVTAALSARQSIELCYLSTIGDWVQMGPVVAVI